jgi:enoyl-CoA hydratase/carnithine racemase
MEWEFVWITNWDIFLKDNRSKMMPDYVLTRSIEQVFIISLNRPEKRNAIHWPMMEALGNALDIAEQTESMRSIILLGEGQVFSSGIDLIAFPEIADTFGENWRERMTSVTAAYQGVLNKLERSNLPTIALLRGFALGLGLELALACDFRLAARHTHMGLPEARLGLIPDVGGTTRLMRLIGPSRAKELILTGRMITTEEAERWGLVNRVAPAGDLLDVGVSFAREIAACAPLAVSYAKNVINQLADVERGLQLEALAQNHLIQTDDFMHGVQAMLAKETPHWHGK